MKRLIKIVSLVIFLMLGLSAYTQNEYRFMNNNMLGFKISGNYSSIGLQPAISDITGDFSYTAGISYSFSNKKYVGIQLDLLFQNRKWHETFDDSLKVITQLNYIQLPLMTNISLGNGRTKYLINLGTYFAYNFSKDIKSDLPEEHNYYQSILDRREKKGDFGLIIGVGLRYFTNLGTFQLDARFEYGYQNLYDEDNSGFRFSNMSVMSAGIYYYFNLKKTKK